MKTHLLLLIFSTSLTLLAPPLSGETLCVDNAAELHAALTTAANNDQADEIHLVQGHYAGSFIYASSQVDSLALRGGYTPNCVVQVVDPLNTRLDSQSSLDVLTFTAPIMAGESLVEGLSLRSGGVTISEGGTYEVLDFEILAERFDISDPRDFVEQQYRDFLGREGEAAGIAFWVQQLQTNLVTRSQVVDSFFSSAEFQINIAPVARLYFAFFNRIPEYTGMMYWVQHMLAGGNLADVSQAFAFSQEFLATYGTLDDDAFVDLVYRNVLNREPDGAGRAFWIGQLASGLTRGALMIGFSESGEYRLKRYAAVQVTMIYVGLLRRAPEQDGFDFWQPILEEGGSVLPLIDGFLNSGEYSARFA